MRPFNLSEEAVAHASRGRIVGYLIALGCAELAIIAGQERLTIVIDALLLVAVLASALNFHIRAEPQTPAATNLLNAAIRLRIALIIPPLLRIIAVAIPLENAPEIAQRFAAVPIALIAALFAIRALSYQRAVLGLRLRWARNGIPLDCVVALLGVAIGYIAFLDLRPSPLIDEPTRPQLAQLLALFLLAGFTEELIFRGFIRVAFDQRVGVSASYLYGVVLFTIMSVGFQSPGMIILAAATAALFDRVVRVSGSIFGVAIARGVAGFCLFALFPAYDFRLPF